MQKLDYVILFLIGYIALVVTLLFYFHFVPSQFKPNLDRVLIVENIDKLIEYHQNKPWWDRYLYVGVIPERMGPVLPVKAGEIIMFRAGYIMNYSKVATYESFLICDNPLGDPRIFGVRTEGVAKELRGPVGELLVGESNYNYIDKGAKGLNCFIEFHIYFPPRDEGEGTSIKVISDSFLVE